MLETKNLLKIRQVAELLGVSRATIINWIKDGKIRACQPSGEKGIWLVEESEVEKLLEPNIPLSNDKANQL